MNKNLQQFHTLLWLILTGKNSKRMIQKLFVIACKIKPALRKRITKALKPVKF